MLGERFWSKVAPAEAQDCWVWTASLRYGYGQYALNGKTPQAHRLAYEELRGDIPTGLQLDHLCRNRACVNPWHLEPVTNEVNAQRGEAGEVARARLAQRTHCSNGHPYSDENTRTTESGLRRCRICRRASKRRANPPSGARRHGPLRLITRRLGLGQRAVEVECGHILTGVHVRYIRARCDLCLGGAS